nr:hypothetical protein [Tanacetum cinerariifolium]
MSDSYESGVTYTEVSSPFEELADIGSSRANDHEHLELPGMLEDPYIEVALQASPFPDYIPGPKEPDHMLRMLHPLLSHQRDDGDDEEGSSEDDEDDDMDIEADEEEGEEEHPAPTDSVVVALPAVDQAPSAEETELFETDESAATPPPHPAYRMAARISIPTLVPVPAWSDSEVIRLLATSSPPSSPLSPLSSPPPRIPFLPPPSILSPPLPVLSPAPPPSPIHSLGYRAAMIRLRAEAASTSHSLPLPPPFILSPTDQMHLHQGYHHPYLYQLLLHHHHCNYPLLVARRTDPRPAGGLRADYGFVATIDREIRRDLERKVGYEITDSWDEIVESLQGAPVSTDTELGGYIKEFETRVRRDTDEIYSRLDDEQNQMIEIREIHAANRRRQIVTSEMLRADHRRSAEIKGLRIADRTRQQQLIQTLTVMQTLQGQVTTLQGQVTALQGQKKMAPKRTTRSTADQETTNTTSVTNAQLQVMIDQGITAALAARDALRSTNGDDSHNSGLGVKRIERATRECTYTDFLKCQPLHFKGTEGVVKENQEKDKIRSKPDKNGKRVEAGKSLKQLHLFEESPDIGSPRADDHEYLELPEMLEDPYVEVTLQAPPSPDYIPGPEDPEQAPPSPDYVPGPEHANDEIVAEEQPYAEDASPTAQSPEYVLESDLEAHPEDDDDEDPEEDPAPSAKETEPFETDESATIPPPHPAYRMTARISIPAPVPVPAWSDLEIIPFPPLPPILSPPSPVLSPAPPSSPIRSLGYRATMIRLRAEAASTSHSPPLPPPFILSPTRSDAPSSWIPLLLPISAPTSSPPLQLPFASRREDIPEVTLPPQKRLGIALGPGYEVGESSSAAAARPAGGLRADYDFVATMDREIMRDPEREKSIYERAHHKREYDSRVNERHMQTIKEKVDTSKALDASLVDTKSSETKSVEQDTRSRSGNDAHADDANIIPIYEPRGERKTRKRQNRIKTGQKQEA